MTRRFATLNFKSTKQGQTPAGPRLTHADSKIQNRSLLMCRFFRKNTHFTMPIQVFIVSCSTQGSKETANKRPVYSLSSSKNGRMSLVNDSVSLFSTSELRVGISFRSLKYNADIRRTEITIFPTPVLFEKGVADVKLKIVGER